MPLSIIRSFIDQFACSAESGERPSVKVAHSASPSPNRRNVRNSPTAFRNAWVRMVGVANLAHGVSGGNPVPQSPQAPPGAALRFADPLQSLPT